MNAKAGEHFFLVLPKCDTICMNVFLEELSKTYPEDQILLVCDGASWHKSKGLKIPGNITLLHIPPYTPEMNPIEQIWKQLRAMGFKTAAMALCDDSVSIDDPALLAEDKLAIVLGTEGDGLADVTIDGCTFDNNLPCIAEKEVFVFNNVADRLIAGMQKNGCILLTREQADKLAEVVLNKKVNEKTGKVSYVVNRDCVGRDAHVILAKIGINVGPEIRCAIAEVPFEHLFVQEELMMPILGIVRVRDIDEAIDLACKAEHGNRHTAHMHSKNIDNLSRFAKAVETTIFVKNAPSYAGIGFGGEGHTTFTIAGPTGEGITSARSFTRRRRCVMADSFRII